MALLQITEPGVDSAPHARRLAAGIDLGTTHSLVASVRSGEAQCLTDASGGVLLPSVVHYMGDREPLVGRAALDRAHEDPANTIASVKRLMGRTRDDLATLAGQLPFAVDDHAVPRIHTAAGPRTAVEVSADILRVLRQRAEQTLGDTLEGVVVTVPAYFDDTQRQATRDAAEIAGLNVLRLLAEPTAAAVAYGLDRALDDRDEALIAVFDLGGGTFDISILRLTKGVFEVLATGGDSALGGDDFDRRIAEWLLGEAGIDQPTPEMLWAVLRDARNAKEALTEQEAVTLYLPGGDRSTTLDRARFAALVEPLVERTLRCCRSTLADADRILDDIAEVVLVGGSTRMPVIREAVAAWFGRPPHVEIDPDQVVAIGAALQADRLVGNRPDDELLLLDVIPLSLGIETMGGLTEVLIPRNSPIPVTRGQDFTTFKDGQTALALHVVQGERDVVEKNRSLARFTLRGIPPMTAGAARIRVGFQVDADGLLHVEAYEQTSGVKASIEVKPSHGLTEDEISDMLRRSNASAVDDMHARALREQQVEADRVLEAIDAALQADGDAFLSADERAAIDAARAHLQAVRRDSDDADAIEAAREALEAQSEAFVARRMNASVRRALAGRDLNSIR